MPNKSISLLWDEVIEDYMRPVQYGNQPSLTSLLELFQRNIMSSLNCHQVGEIVSFNPDTQTAEVSVKMTYKVNNEIVDYPLLIDCPCIILGGGKGRLTFPISAGDTCLLLFNDRDIDNWYASGQTMLPRTGRKHSFSDAIALVGPRNMQNKITDYLTTGTELKYGESTIKLEDNKVTVTNGSASIVLDSGTIQITGAVAITGSFTVNGKNVGDTHRHSGVASGSSNTGVVV